MATVEVDARDQIVAFTRSLAANRDLLKRAFADVKDHVTRAADRILSETAAGRPVVPELAYADIRDGKVPESARQSIRDSGCVVIRGVFPAARASGWFADVGDYLETNRYEAREVESSDAPRWVSDAPRRDEAARALLWNPDVVRP